MMKLENRLMNQYKEVKGKIETYREIFNGMQQEFKDTSQELGKIVEKNFQQKMDQYRSETHITLKETLKRVQGCEDKVIQNEMKLKVLSNSYEDMKQLVDSTCKIQHGFGDQVKAIHEKSN